MFALTYLPQLGILIFVNGPLAVFTTVVLVLNESSTIINMVARGWLLQDALLDTFDGTLVARGQTGTLSEGREIKSGGDSMQKLGRVLKSPFSKFSPKALVRYIMYLPLNFIPVVGTVIFVALQGQSNRAAVSISMLTIDYPARTRGKGVHGRVSFASPFVFHMYQFPLTVWQYFQLKKWSASQQSDWLEKHVGPYTAYVNHRVHRMPALATGVTEHHTLQQANMRFTDLVWSPQCWK